MSDNLDLLRHVHRINDQVQQTLVVERPGTRLPFVPRALNPIARGASGAIVGDVPFGARALTVLGLTLCVVVITTNNGANYWTIELRDTTNTTTYASATTAALTVGVWGVLRPTVSAVPSTEVVLSVRATATGAPGSVYVVPEIIVA